MGENGKIKLLGMHANSTTNKVVELAAAWKPPIIVVLDHSDAWKELRAELPNTIMVGRVVTNTQFPYDDPRFNPALAAKTSVGNVLPIADRWGDTYDYWVGENEPVIATKQGMQAYADFEIARTRLMYQSGHKVAVGGFAVGNPRLNIFGKFEPAIRAAVEHNGVLALHAYGWPRISSGWPWYALRYRKMYYGNLDLLDYWEGLPEDLRETPLIITEGGLDVVGSYQPPGGWKVQYKDDIKGYFQQLRWLDFQLRADKYVLGCALYCFGCGNWPTYDHIDDDRMVRFLLENTERTVAEEPCDEPDIEETDNSTVAKHTYRFGYRQFVDTTPLLLVYSSVVPGIKVILKDAWGNVQTTITGAKESYGRGGFEFYVSHNCQYTLRIGDQEFHVVSDGHHTLIGSLQEIGV